MTQTKALQYIQSKGWEFKPSGSDKVELKVCPYCHKDNYGHFYMVIAETNQDGLWSCHRCGKSGNLITLQQDQGDRIAGVDSRKEWAKSKEDIESMPDIEAMHQALLENADAMDYLVNTRGFSRDIIQKQKLGYTPKRFFRNCGEVPGIAYPYIVGNNAVFVHWRTLPPADKQFSSLKGWDAPLYNGAIIKHGLKEVTMVEGEANVIAALDHEIEDIVGVPGANFKKALWIETLDQIEVEKVYICYDKDKVGQKAAQTLASRIGIQKCWKITLPDFTVPVEGGGTKRGKDLNEWFLYGGGTKEAFEELKQNAVLFDVQGVMGSGDALTELEEFLDGKGSLQPTYKTPWPKLNELVGFEDGDTIDIVAPEKIGKTTFGLNLLEYAVDTYEEDGILICLEMPIMRVARKWVSHVTGTDDSIPKNPAEDAIKVAAMKAAIPVAREKAAKRKGDLYFCYPQIRDTEDVYKLMIDCIRRYGVKWIMFDNVQKLCDRTLKDKGHRTIHLSQISKKLDAIAKDYGVKMIRILQPHRIKDGEILTTDDVDGSSQIAKDCDCMLTLHRSRIGGDLTQNKFDEMGVAEAEQAFDSRMLVTVGLSRYSCGGYCTLEFDGATSTVKSLDAMTRLRLEANKPVSGYEVPKEKLEVTMTTPSTDGINP